MVVAITFGIIMASVMFMRNMAKMTKVHNLSLQRHIAEKAGEGYEVLAISGPLFFASAERTFRKIRHDCINEPGLILDFISMNMLDAGGDHCLEQFCQDMKKKGVTLIFTGLQYQPLRCMVKSSFDKKHPEVRFTSTLDEALALSKEIPIKVEK